MCIVLGIHSSGFFSSCINALAKTREVSRPASGGAALGGAGIIAASSARIIAASAAGIIAASAPGGFIGSSLVASSSLL